MSKKEARKKAAQVRASAEKVMAKEIRREAGIFGLIKFKLFQIPIFWSVAGVLILHWSRQIGKSYVLAAWAVYRLLTKPGRLVTVLSNSKDNGIEFMQKVREVCALAGIAFSEEDLSPDEFFENMQIEARIKVGGKTGRIKVLAANPRTARGFSGDLILDEFAFHENSIAIWDAAEPIISSNPDFECRIASTGNGRFNMFYQMVAGATGAASKENPAGLSESANGYLVSRVARTAAYTLGQKIYDPKTRAEITPEEARKKSLDKASYDQNYELAFNDENTTLLTHELISACEYSDQIGNDTSDPQCFICEQEWSPLALAFLARCNGPLVLGQDVGRNRDISVQAVGEKVGGVIFTRGLLRMQNMRLPAQKVQLGMVCRLSNFAGALIDLTGIGLGLVEFGQDAFGYYRVQGLHFASKEHRDPTQARLAAQKQKATKTKHPADTALVTELMAIDMLQMFSDRGIRIPREQELRDALRKPQKIVTASGVRIAADTDDAGHADEFWAIALMQRRMKSPAGTVTSTEGVRLGGQRKGARFNPRRLGGHIRANRRELNYA